MRKGRVETRAIEFMPTDATKFEKYVTSGPGKNINETNPYLLCQYIFGKPFLVNIICQAGEITDFDIHTSNLFLYPKQEQKVFDTVQTFCQEKYLTGFSSFHFILEDVSEKIVCVGCNPTLSIDLLERHGLYQVYVV